MENKKQDKEIGRLIIENRKLSDRIFELAEKFEYLHRRLARVEKQAKAR
jgi:hypothetical protein